MCVFCTYLSTNFSTKKTENSLLLPQFVDYRQLRQSAEFAEYTLLARELQRAPLDSLSEEGRRTFFLNIYNALVVHGLAVGGPPGSFVQQMRVWKAITNFFVYLLNQDVHISTYFAVPIL